MKLRNQKGARGKNTRPREACSWAASHHLSSTMGLTPCASMLSYTCPRTAVRIRLLRRPGQRWAAAEEEEGG
jgi:hypothetical protein